MNRKLPPDSEVAALHLSGWKYRQIADRYSVTIAQVFKAMERWNGRQGHQHAIKRVHDDRSFTAAGRQPVDHRDTGTGIGFGKVEDPYRVRHTSLNDCADLLREWGVQ